MNELLPFIAAMWAICSALCAGVFLLPKHKVGGIIFIIIAIIIAVAAVWLALSIRGVI